MDTAGELFQRGIEFQERGLFDHAIEQYNRALELEPENVAVMINLGAAYLQKGLSERSTQILSKVIDKDPENSLALFNMGKAFLYKEEPEKALEAFRRASDVVPEDVEIRRSMAHCLSLLGRKEESASILYDVVDSFSENVEGLIQLGRDLIESEKFTQALEVYRKAVSVACDSTEALEGLTKCQLALGMRDKAMTTLKRGFMVDPKNPAFNIMMVDLMIEGNQIDDAVSQLRKALANDPSHPLLRQKMDEISRRMPVLKKRNEEQDGPSVSHSPFETEVYDILDGLYDGRTSIDDASSALKDIAANNPDDIFVAEELGNLLYQSRNFEDAFQMYSYIFKTSTPDPRHRINLAKSLAMSGRVAEAKEFLEDSLKEVSGVADLHLALVELQLLEKDFTGAQEALSLIMNDFPENSHGLFLQGYIALRLDDLDLADKSFKLLLRISPTDEEVALWYSKLAILKGAPQEAQKIWENFNDGIESLLEILAKVELALASGNSEAVPVLLKRIGDYQPRFLEDHLLFGKASFYMGDLSQALRELEMVLKEDPEKPEALALAALVYLARNKPAKFWMYWQKAIECDALYPFMFCLILGKSMNFNQIRRLKEETQKILEISVQNPVDRRRLNRIMTLL